MSLSAVVAAGDAGAATAVISAVAVAALALAGAVYQASSALRQSTQANRAALDKIAYDRDAAHDARVERDAERHRLESEALRAFCDGLTEQLRELRERHARLRLAVIAHGLDPDEIITPRVKGPTDAGEHP